MGSKRTEQSERGKGARARQRNQPQKNLSKSSGAPPEGLCARKPDSARPVQLQGIIGERPKNSLKSTQSRTRARGFIYASATPPVRLGCSLNPHRQTRYASFNVLVRSTASGAGRTAGRARHKRYVAVHSSPTGVGHTAAAAGHRDMIPARAARNATFLTMPAHGQEQA